MRIFVCIFPVHRCLALHCTDTGKVKFDFFEVTEWTSFKNQPIQIIHAWLLSLGLLSQLKYEVSKDAHPKNVAKVSGVCGKKNLFNLYFNKFKSMKISAIRVICGYKNHL